MSLDKAIDSGKERRKPYRKSNRFDKTCRNHGTCPRCKSDRTHAGKRQEPVEGDVALWDRDAKWHAMSCTSENLGAFDYANQAMDAVERWANKRHKGVR